jgi:hypothetical protein
LAEAKSQQSIKTTNMLSGIFLYCVKTEIICVYAPAFSVIKKAPQSKIEALLKLGLAAS